MAEPNTLLGHNLVWYNQLPDWVTANDYNATGLTAVIQNHIANVAGHYKGQPWVLSSLLTSIFFSDLISDPLIDVSVH